MSVTVDQFLERAQAQHKGYYSYSKVRKHYVDMQTPVPITCPVHGDFMQKPRYHGDGSGCRVCVDAKPHYTTEQFVAQCVKVHGSKYDYRKTVFKDIRDKVEIVCKVHGSFWQDPKNHRGGAGCPRCGTIEGARKIVRHPQYNLKSSRIIILAGYEFYVDSKAEILFLERAIQTVGAHQIKDQRATPIIEYSFENKERSHRPDFYIPSRNMLVEVKSPFTLGCTLPDLFGRSAESVYQQLRAKAKAASAAGYAYRLVVVAGQRVCQLHPNWFINYRTVNRMKTILSKELL